MIPNLPIERGTATSEHDVSKHSSMPCSVCRHTQHLFEGVEKMLSTRSAIGQRVGGCQPARQTVDLSVVSLTLRKSRRVFPLHRFCFMIR